MEFTKLEQMKIKNWAVLVRGGVMSIDSIDIKYRQAVEEKIIEMYGN